MDRGPAHPHSRVPTATTAPGTPLPGSAPPTPRRRRPLLPAPRVRQRPRRSTTRFPEPRQPSPQPGAGSGGPKAPAPMRPAAVPVRSPGHSPSARALGGVRAQVAGRGPPGSDPRRSPYLELMELLRLCLQGLSPARTLKKYFRGSGGGKGFGTGTARGLGLLGPPRRGGAGPPLRAARKSAPDRSINLSASPTLGSPGYRCFACCSVSDKQTEARRI